MTAANPFVDSLVVSHRFGPDFVWGVATAAYQIEGAADQDGRGPSIWDTFSCRPGATRHGDTGDIACDHYRRWADDLDLMVELGVPAYRLSVSWSRLQPSGRGDLNPHGVAFYRSLLAGLSQRGIQPFVTLYHWDLPQPLEDEGGWTSRETAYRFAEFSARTVQALGDLADHWITLNEPWCSSFLGYGSGAHAPGRTDYRAATAAVHHLNLAHGLAVRGIRDMRPDAQVGVTNIVTDIVPATDAPADVSAARRLDATSNQLFLGPMFQGEYPSAVRDCLGPLGLDDHVRPGDLQIISTPVDFAGINHYHRDLARHDDQAPFGVTSVPAEPATTAFGWSVVPESLTAVLQRVARDYTDLPLYVTESGASFHDYVDPEGRVQDEERVDYLARYIEAVGVARESGVDVAGYFAWSLLDNFEWGEGYSQRFGLVYVDFGSQRRVPKLSARWYSQHIARQRSQGQPSNSGSSEPLASADAAHTSAGVLMTADREPKGKF